MESPSEQGHKGRAAADVMEIDGILVPSRSDVLDRCALEGTGSGFAYNKDIWIKCAVHTTSAEVAAQEYAYQHADREIFRVPRIYDWFVGGNITFIIMERVIGVTYEEYARTAPPMGQDERHGIIFRLIVDSVKHIQDFPIKNPPGPLATMLPEDRFFHDAISQDPDLMDIDSDNNDLLFPRQYPLNPQDISLLRRPLESIADLQDWCNAKLKENAAYLEEDFEWVNFESPSPELAFCHMFIR
jgi:hypothetical protein